MCNHYPKDNSQKRDDRALPLTGFTLVEVLIVIAIVAIIAGVSLLSLQGTKNSTDLNNAAKQIVSILRQAQTQAASDYQGAAWGVHFVNATASFYAIFSSAYSPTSTVNRYLLPTTVAFRTSTVPASSSLDVVFSALSGVSSVSTSITLYSTVQPSFSSTIRVASSGEVSF